MGNIETNIAIYSELVKQHGISHKSLNWGSKESQEKRFKTLMEVGDLEGQTVLDVGCGIGDLYDWLNINQFGLSGYKGVDITPAMIAQSQQRFPNASFEVTNILNNQITPESYDFVFASGIFYLNLSNSYEFMFDMIFSMYRIARKGIAFNTLSHFVQEKQENEFYADPGRVLNYCYSLTNKLILRNDYHPSDFTIYLYK